MEVGAFTDYIDLAQVVLYLFWAFFFGLVLWIRREDKREGYPLESERSYTVRVQGFPPMPPPKAFKVHDGRTIMAPREEPFEEVANARPAEAWPGAPLEPVGDPMLAGVGSGAYTVRPAMPETTLEGEPKVQPMRVMKDYTMDPRDPNPIGMQVVGLDGEVGGTVVDAWVDVIEPQLRYLEIDLGEAAGGRHVMLPMTLARVSKDKGQVEVNTITGAQFRDVPTLSNPDIITMQEEDRVVAYYGAGVLYATEKRAGPLV
jgi:photosynthetic reaction center H subunit